MREISLGVCATTRGGNGQRAFLSRGKRRCLRVWSLAWQGQRVHQGKGGNSHAGCGGPKVTANQSGRSGDPAVPRFGREAEFGGGGVLKGPQEAGGIMRGQDEIRAHPTVLAVFVVPRVWAGAADGQTSTVVADNRSIILTWGGAGGRWLRYGWGAARKIGYRCWSRWRRNTGCGAGPDRFGKSDKALLD